VRRGEGDADVDRGDGELADPPPAQAPCEQLLDERDERHRRGDEGEVREREQDEPRARARRRSADERAAEHEAPHQRERVPEHRRGEAVGEHATGRDGVAEEAPEVHGVPLRDRQGDGCPGLPDAEEERAIGTDAWRPRPAHRLERADGGEPGEGEPCRDRDDVERDPRDHLRTPPGPGGA
jgi:hypothetical protein